MHIVTGTCRDRSADLTGVVKYYIGGTSGVRLLQLLHSTTSRGRRHQSDNTDLQETMSGATGVEQSLEALQAVRISSTTAPGSPCRAPTFEGKGDVELFVQQFMDIAEENNWQERRTLLQLSGSLGGLAQIYSRAETAEEIYAALLNRFGALSQCLLSLSRGPQGSVSDFGVEICHLA